MNLLLPTVDDPLHLRKMTWQDLPAVHRLSSLVGWSHRPEDWQFMFQSGQGWIAEIHGRIVGCALYWLWGSSAATVGMVIVSPDWQGKRIGFLVMEKIMSCLEGYQVRLHATAMGKGLYQKFGFKDAGIVTQYLSNPLPKIQACNIPEPLSVRLAYPSDKETLTALDYLSTGLLRTELIEQILTDGIKTIVLLDKHQQIIGFAGYRKFGRGVIIGPVAASNIEQAKVLISQFFSDAAGLVLRIDITDNASLARWLEDLGFTPVSIPIVMYKGRRPAEKRQCSTFAIVTQALG